MSSAAEIGSRYGSSINDYTTASNNTVEAIVIEYCNKASDDMRKMIQSKVRSRGASTLAQGIQPTPVTVTGSIIDISIISEADYWQYRDDGVQGVYINKAPQSKFKFKNLGTPPKMINSFKQFIAKGGIKVVDKKVMSFKGKKRKQALSDQEKAARTLAVRTKIGGIEPLNFSDIAIEPQRINKLSNDIAEALSEAIAINISKTWQ